MSGSARDGFGVVRVHSFGHRLAFHHASTQFTSEAHLRKRVALFLSLFGGGLKAETTREKCGEPIPCLGTARQRARMVAHGRYTRAITVWYKVYLVLCGESKRTVKTRYATSPRHHAPVTGQLHAPEAAGHTPQALSIPYPPIAPPLAYWSGKKCT